MFRWWWWWGGGLHHVKGLPFWGWRVSRDNVCSPLAMMSNKIGERIPTSRPHRIEHGSPRGV